MRRASSVSVNEEQQHSSTPPLLAAPSSELDWSDDNPFAFLKTPAPPPPSASSGFVHHQHTHSHAHPPRLAPSEINSSGETLPARKRPRSHSSSMKVRFELMEPPPPLVPPVLPLELTDLTPEQSNSLQIIQAYFRGRIERAKVKHMVEKQVLGRRFTMEEILLSERRYVHHLDLIVNLFLRPLQKTDILTPAEINAIFMNVEKLHQMARSFLSKLEELFTEDPLVIGHRVGLLFLNTIPEWRAYSYLVNHFEGAQVQLTKCKERKSFREWMQKAESHPSMEKLGMMDYMIAAAKRVPQYQLLLKAVKKNTPKASRHYQTIKTAKTMIGELAQFLNERKRSFDNMRKIELIQRSLNGKIPNLMTTGREFVAETVVKEEDATARLIIDRHIYLFNDSLLVATASNHKFDRLIYLTGAEMITKTARKLILRVDDVSLVIVFQTEQEKTRWVALVGHAIETLAFQEQSSVLKDFAPAGVPKPKVLNSVILHQGYLLKHRRSSGGWNKRWFVLEQGILYYVKNPTKIEGITARGTIDLGAYSIRSPLDWTSGGKRRHGFELTSRSRPVFVLASEDPRSRDEWVQALKPFLQSTKPTERDGILYAASTSSDIARTSSSSRVLLPSYKPSPSHVGDDLIQWSSDPSNSTLDSSHFASSSVAPGTPSTTSPSLSASNKFYFNEDYMDRATATEPDPDWFTSVSALPSPPSSQKTHPLRRSISSSSVTSS
jgi:predicted nucleic acid-binding protein